MNYSQAVTYLNGFVNFEHQFIQRPGTTDADIDRFAALLEALGSPHTSYPVIHIAGTKGKGSTGAMIASILRHSGYNVGFYTSPHLVTVRERIRVNNEIISREHFANAIQRIASLSDNLKIGNQPAFRTVFEHLTAAAFLHFKQRGVNVAVIEAGLGAKLDATIVVRPRLSIMTPIGLDHTNILGDTIALIAEDKSYVIKQNIPIVSAPQTDEALDVIRRRAEQMNASLVIAPGRREFNRVRLEKSFTLLETQRLWLGTLPIRLALAGDFQLDNLSTSLTAIEVLRRMGWTIPPETVAKGLAAVKWRGRLQVMRGRPRLVLDGGHNVLAVNAIIQTLPKILPRQKNWKVVFSALSGKPVREMFETITRLTDSVFIAPLRFPKAMKLDKLISLSKSAGLHPNPFDTVPDAFDAARRGAGQNGAVLVIGSFYLLGEVFRHLRRLPPPPGGKIDDRI